MGYLPLSAGSRVLDVCAGTGHVSRAIAPRVGQVVAVDLTAEMLRELTKQAAAARLANLVAVRALAEALPLKDDVFDCVVSRLSFHHVHRPADLLAEMKRTCAGGGTIGILDLVAPDDSGIAESYNRLERLRDPSHVRALSEQELQRLIVDAGLIPVDTARRDIEVDVEAWLALTKTPTHDADEIRGSLAAEIEGGPRTGMRPFGPNNALAFVQRWVVSVARKP